MPNATAAAPVRAHKATPRAEVSTPPPPARPIQGEAAPLFSQAVRIIQTLVMRAIDYSNSHPTEFQVPVEVSNADVVLCHLIDPTGYDRLEDAPSDQLGQLNYAWLLLDSALADTRDAAAADPGAALHVTLLAERALHLITDLVEVYKGLPGTIDELRAMTTFAGVCVRSKHPMPPTRQDTQKNTSPPATKRQRHPTELLMDQLQIGATIATVLYMNFGGDGSFDPPHEAPGVNGMVGALATAAACACRLASEQGRTDLPHIAHAAALAEHMEMLSNEELMDGSRGFRQGDQLLGMSFWCIETMLESACREVEQL